MVTERAPNGRIESLRAIGYLEKSCIRHWSIGELQKVVRDRSQSADVFRPYFLLVLRTVLQHFAKNGERERPSAHFLPLF